MWRQQQLQRERQSGPYARVHRCVLRDCGGGGAPESTGFLGRALPFSFLALLLPPAAILGVAEEARARFELLFATTSPYRSPLSALVEGSWRLPPRVFANFRPIYS